MTSLRIYQFNLIIAIPYIYSSQEQYKSRMERAESATLNPGMA
jgi:hypothetical protein